MNIENTNAIKALHFFGPTQLEFDESGSNK